MQAVIAFAMKARSRAARGAPVCDTAAQLEMHAVREYNLYIGGKKQWGSK